MKTLIVASLFGLAAGQYGTNVTEPEPAPSVAAEQSQTVPTTTLMLPGAEYRTADANMAIAADVNNAATHIEASLDKAPGVASAMAKSINTHGPVRAILYEDPEVKAAADSMATSLGRGLRALGDAITRDMTEGSRQLQQPSRS